VERVVVELEASWRESLRGEKVFVERLLRGERLQEETPPMERTAKEREASWRNSLRGQTSPRRDNLPGEDSSGKIGSQFLTSHTPS
jgi:hypothetical protein